MWAVGIRLESILVFLWGCTRVPIDCWLTLTKGISSLTLLSTSAFPTTPTIIAGRFPSMVEFSKSQEPRYLPAVTSKSTVSKVSLGLLQTVKLLMNCRLSSQLSPNPPSTWPQPPSLTPNNSPSSAMWIRLSTK